MGRGHVRVEKQAVEDKDSKWRPVVHVREKRRCVRVRRGSHLMVEIKVLCFRWLSPFFKLVQKGFPGFS